MRKNIAVFSAMAFLILTGLGCGKNSSQFIADKMVEKTIENKTGAKVNIDSNGNSVKYETDQGTIESGDNLTLPADFPKDVFVVSGKIISVISNKENGVFSVSLESGEKADDIEKKYEEQMVIDGWKISGKMNFGDTYSLVAEKEGRQASVMIGKGDGKTTVVISIGKK